MLACWHGLVYRVQGVLMVVFQPGWLLSILDNFSGIGISSWLVLFLVKGTDGCVIFLTILPSNMFSSRPFRFWSFFSFNKDVVFILITGTIITGLVTGGHLAHEFTKDLDSSDPLYQCFRHWSLILGRLLFLGLIIWAKFDHITIWL